MVRWPLPFAGAVVLAVGPACADDGPRRWDGIADDCRLTPIVTASIGFPGGRRRHVRRHRLRLAVHDPTDRAGKRGQDRVARDGPRPAVGGRRRPDRSGAPARWGPEAHGQSNWDRPGGEWGTGVVFDRPGGRHLQAQREGVRGDVWLDVIA